MTSSGFDPEFVPIDVSVDDAMIRVRFTGGLELATPVSRFPRLVRATTEQRRVWRLIGRGDGIQWPEVDEDISVRGLFSGVRRVASSAMEEVPALISELYRTTGRLNKIFHHRPFTPDGHLVGSIGEVVAEFVYGLELQSCSTPRVDAHAQDGRSVQIKLTGQNGTSYGIQYSKDDLEAPDLLICLKLTQNGFQEVYNGPFPVHLLRGKKDQSNGQVSLSVSQLKKNNPETLPKNTSFQRSIAGSRRSCPMSLKLGIIAGNGRFPFLLLDAARAHGLTVVVAAIREETDPEIDARASADSQVRVHWLSLGELSRLIEIFHAEGVTRAVMAGQVRHKQIFSSIRPDWRLAKLLLNLRTRNTDMLLGAIAKVMADEGIELVSSTAYLEPLLAKAGVMTERGPTADEAKDIAYGRSVARGVAAWDLGQTVVIAAGACIAVEAMEGTDATIERAGALLRGLGAGAGETVLLGALTVVKVAKPNQDMRFDVPVVGVRTIEAMVRAGATCLCVEAGRTLLFDPEGIRTAANAAAIAIVGQAEFP